LAFKPALLGFAAGLHWRDQLHPAVAAGKVGAMAQGDGRTAWKATGCPTFYEQFPVLPNASTKPNFAVQKTRHAATQCLQGIAVDLAEFSDAVVATQVRAGAVVFDVGSDGWAIQRAKAQGSTGQCACDRVRAKKAQAHALVFSWWVRIGASERVKVLTQVYARARNCVSSEISMRASGWYSMPRRGLFFSLSALHCYESQYIALNGPAHSPIRCFVS
jgi:Zn-dependent alcohol dehydrogenase